MKESQDSRRRKSILRAPRQKGYLTPRREIIRDLATDPELGLETFGLYVYLVERADLNTWKVRASLRELAHDLHIGRNTVRRHLGKLDGLHVRVTYGKNADAVTEIEILDLDWFLSVDPRAGIETEPAAESEGNPLAPKRSHPGIETEPARSKTEPPMEPLKRPDQRKRAPRLRDSSKTSLETPARSRSRKFNICSECGESAPFGRDRHPEGTPGCSRKAAVDAD